MKKLLFSFTAALFALQSFALTFPVTNTATNGLGSLTQAVLDANASPGVDTITFSIGSGIATIFPMSTYVITESVVIDGTTQPGYNFGTYEPIIQLNGLNLAGSSQIMDITGTASNCVIKGLIFTNNFERGLSINSNSNQVKNCWFGLDSTGVTSMRLDNGIYMQNCSGNTIGGSSGSAADRCVFAGIFYHAILIEFGNDNFIGGNYIGLNKFGNAPDTTYIGSRGVKISNYVPGLPNRIGMPGFENFIAGFSYGIELFGMQNTEVKSNRIGLNANEIDSVPNLVNGIFLNGSSRHNTIGGSSAGEANFICGNPFGIEIISFSDSNTFRNNVFGLTPIGNLKTNTVAMQITNSYYNQIGAPGAGNGNTFAMAGPGFKDGIVLTGAQFTKIENNLFGTNTTGTAACGPSKGYYGVRVLSGSDNTVIGGTSPTQRNLFSNLEYGVEVQSTSNTLVQNNFFGTDLSGNTAISNQYGIIGNTGTNNLTIRDNLISACSGHGIFVSAPGAHVWIMGNKIGTDVSGMASIVNSGGIYFSAKGRIGSANPADKNVISGVTTMAIEVTAQSDSVYIKGNYLGVQASGVSAIPNGGDGIVIRANHSVIGGVNAGEGNIIANHSGTAVIVSDVSATSANVNCLVTGNAMYNNSFASGIDIIHNGASGLSANDLNDADALAANKGQNYPLVKCFTQRQDLSGFDIDYTLNSEPLTQYMLDFYADNAGASTHGQGRYFLGRQFVTTNGSGNVSGKFFTSFSLSGLEVSMTASDTLARITSEFSPVVNQFQYNIITAPSCAANPSGFAVAQTSGGGGGNTYLWQTGVTNDSLMNILPGSYTVQLQSASGCNILDTAIVNSLPGINIFLTPSNSTCGSANGSINSNVSGGAAPYDYYWSTSATVANISNLAAGQYLLQVTDANGCYSSDVALVQDGNGPNISLVGITHVSCNGLSDGAVDITISGGATPYNILWSNNVTVEDISSLPAGSYDVMVTDNGGCVASAIYTVMQPSALSFNSSPVSPTTCGGIDGSASVIVLGGSGPYSVVWDGNTGGQIGTIATNLPAGAYQAWATDNNGCVDSVMVSVSDPGTLSVSIDSFMNAGCVLNGGNGAIYTTPYGAGPYTYLWTNGATTDDVTGLGIGNFGLTVTDQSTGCKATVVKRITGESPGTAQICMLTVDTATNFNMIVWNDSVQGIAEYRIFRETSVSGNYNLITTIQAGTANTYVDSLADANVKPWRYEIQTTDSCGRISTYSLSNKTIHLNVLVSTNFGFDLYWDEFQGTDVTFTHYKVWRMHPSTGWQQLTTVPLGSTLFYNDASPLVPTDSNFYFVEIDANASCNSTRTIVNTSRSNIKNQLAPPTLSLNNQQDLSLVNIYPNPANNVVMIELGNMRNTSIEVFDMLGQLVIAEKTSSVQNKIQLSTAALANGVYSIRISGEQGKSTKKLIIER